VNYRTREILGVIIALAVALLLSALAARDALAATAFEQWRSLQDACQSRPDGPACAQRDRIARDLRAHGAAQLPNDEWATRDELAYFDRVADVIGSRVPDAVRLNAPHAVVEQAADALRWQLTDAQIVGIWRMRRLTIMNRTPAGYAVFSTLMPYIARQHPSTDVRYMVDN
jgi:hypothetical protein